MANYTVYLVSLAFSSVLPWGRHIHSWHNLVAWSCIKSQRWRTCSWNKSIYQNEIINCKMILPVLLLKHSKLHGYKRLWLWWIFIAGTNWFFWSNMAKYIVYWDKRLWLRCCLHSALGVPSLHCHTGVLPWGRHIHSWHNLVAWSCIKSQRWRTCSRNKSIYQNKIINCKMILPILLCTGSTLAWLQEALTLVNIHSWHQLVLLLKHDEIHRVLGQPWL